MDQNSNTYYDYMGLCEQTIAGVPLLNAFIYYGITLRCLFMRPCEQFTSKSTWSRDMLFLLIDTLSVKDGKLFKACRYVCSSVPQNHYKCGTPHPKCENFNTLSQFSH